MAQAFEVRFGAWYGWIYIYICIAREREREREIERDRGSERERERERENVEKHTGFQIEPKYETV